MGLKGFRYRGQGRKGIAGRQIARPRKTGVRSSVKTGVKKIKPAFGGIKGYGTFGFQ